MSASLHLDLLTDEEHVSSSPVRLRVMVPMLTLLAVLAIAVWWSFFVLRLHAATLQKIKLEANVAGLKPAHAEVVRLRAQEKECAAALQQLGFYRNARIRFGETFARLAEHVPADLQLIELRVPPPQQPPQQQQLSADPKKKTPLLGPTNVLETVTLRLAGRAGGENPSEAINRLLQALRTPAFTNLILSAETPKGAFRQDTTTKASSNRDELLFEITCGCVPRRFE